MRRNKHPATGEDTEGIIFGPFRLTRSPLRLWRGRGEVRLQPRQLAVLHYFVEHVETVVSREELLREVWSGTVVTPAALQVCVSAVRQALGDEVEAPRYIETVGREGYRFIEKVVSSQYPVVSSQQEERQKAKAAFLSPAPNTQYLVPNLVGREAELAQLHNLLFNALNGERQLIPFLERSYRLSVRPPVIGSHGANPVRLHEQLPTATPQGTVEGVDGGKRAIGEPFVH